MFYACWRELSKQLSAELVGTAQRIMRLAGCGDTQLAKNRPVQNVGLGCLM